MYAGIVLHDDIVFRLNLVVAQFAQEQLRNGIIDVRDLVAAIAGQQVAVGTWDL